MKRHVLVVGSLTLAGLAVLPAASASANGGRGSSYCSNSGPPEGEFAGDISNDQTYGNAGEVVSWYSQLGLEPVGPWGLVVKGLCDPRPS